MLEVMTLLRFVKGWPEPTDAKARAEWYDDDRVVRLPIVTALTMAIDEDVHFAAYNADVQRRHTIRLLQDPAHADKIAAVNLRMVAAVFDVDDPIAHEQNIPARAEWWDDELPKLQNLINAHNVFLYATEGGYRTVAALPEPFPLRCQGDDDTWRARYLSWIKYLRRRFEIRADKSCHDWTRLYRIPHATKQGSTAPLDLSTFGDPNALGVWAPKLWKKDMVAVEPRGGSTGNHRDVEGSGPGATVEPIPIGDPDSEYARYRIDMAVRYLQRAPLICFKKSGQDPPRRDAMFSLGSYLVRRLQLPADVAVDITDAVYNPRLSEAGLVPWNKDKPGDYGMSLRERFEAARDRGRVPAGDVLTESVWRTHQTLFESLNGAR
jgi:hypothetical protein